MRIAIYDPYTDTLGGGEKYMYTLAECLVPKHNVSAFWNNKSDVQAIAKRFSLDLTQITVTPNIFTPSYSMKDRLVTARTFDRIVYLSDGSLPLIFNRNLIVHFQFPVEWVHPTPFMKIKLQQVKRIICNSQFTKSYIDNKFGVVSNVLYPPVEIKAKVVTKENIILHVGRFAGTTIEGTDYKKQQVMVQTYKELVDTGLKGWKCIIAASVKDEDRKRFDEMRLSAKGYDIEFLVNESNDALWNTYSKAKIYWHASGFGEDVKTHPELAEHFGISTVEAMGAGCVPVVVGLGGQKEIITDEKNGLLWHTKTEWIEKTLELTTDEEKMHRLSAAARERAKDFSKDAFSQHLAKLII